MMSRSALAALCTGSYPKRPETLDELLASVEMLLPMLDAIANAH